LWFGPPLLLGAGLLTLWLLLRRRSRMAASEFDPDEEDMAAAQAAQRQDAR
jgi:cytochrome c-type biogenesis protein CcmH